MVREPPIHDVANARATAARWRSLAQQTQAAAEKIADPRERLALLLIARAYEQLARTTDRIRKSSNEEQTPD